MSERQVAEAVGIGGGIVAVAFSVLAMMRRAGLAFSRDRVTVATDQVEADSIRALASRVAELDARVRQDEEVRAHLFGFLVRSMSYIARCECVSHDEERHDLMADYNTLMHEIYRNKKGGDDVNR